MPWVYAKFYLVRDMFLIQIMCLVMPSDTPLGNLKTALPQCYESVDLSMPVFFNRFGVCLSARCRQDALP